MPSFLSADDWKKQIKADPKGPALAPVTKALEAYGKLDEDDYEERVSALDQVVTAARVAKTKNSAKKDLAGYLEDMIAEGGKAQKVARDLAAKAEEGDEGLVLKAMIQKVRKLNEKGAKPFVLALGKPSGLVIARGPTAGGEHKKRARAMRTGNGKLLLGHVFGEEGRAVFRLDVEPPGGLAKAIKKAVLAHTKLPLRVLVKGPKTVLDDETDIEDVLDPGTDDEEVGTGKVETYAERRDQTPTVATKEQAEFEQKLDAMKAQILEAEKPESGIAAEVKLTAGEARALARAGRFEEALRRLGALEELIRTGPGPKATAATDPARAAYERRLAVVAPLIDTAVKAKGGTASWVRTTRSEMEFLARTGKFKPALDMLAQIERLVDQVEAKGVFEKLVAALQPKHLARLSAHPEQAPKLTMLMEYALEKGEAAAQLEPAKQNAAYTQAVKALRQYEAMADTLPDRPAVVSQAALKRSAQLWESAVKKAKAELQTLAAAMRDEFKGEPEADEVNAAADEIAGAIRDFEGRLAGLLTKAASEADDAKRRPLASAAVLTFRDHSRQLAERPLLVELDKNPFVKVNVYKTLELTVREVGKALGA